MCSTSGALFFWIEKEAETCMTAMPVLIAIAKTKFSQNKATAAGGALFTNTPQGMHVCCDCDHITNREEELIDRECPIVHGSSMHQLNSINGCPNPCNQTWNGNIAGEIFGGHAVSTIGDFVSVCKSSSRDNYLCTGPRKPLRILNHTSGEDLESVYLDLNGAFEYLELGQTRAHVEVTSNSTNVHLRNRLIARLEPNTSLTSIHLQAAVGQIHTLVLEFIPPIFPDLSIEIEVRPCLPGEILEFHGERCVACKEGSYSFGPFQNCIKCPSFHAVCRQSTITPEDGFWHSTSKSSQIHKCILKEACKYEGRNDVLEGQSSRAHANGDVLNYDNNVGYQLCSQVNCT